MTIPPLTIIPAGAGSGKTHTIQTQLAEWVVAGLVAPDRIVAVTFTEAAASELRERIRSELTSRGRLEDALRLEQAYITTIHGFGLRILTEFAFDAGMSPAPRLLDEDESDILVRRALAETDRADAVMGNLSSHGYSYDFMSGKGAEALMRQHAGETRPLNANWRSTPALMTVINRIGTGLFGNGYTPLTPRASYPTSMIPLELLNFVKSDTIKERTRFTIGRIRQLLLTPPQWHW